MRRSSAETRRLVDLFTGQGVPATGRQIEDWSHAGLLWPEDTSDERKVEHVRQLLAVHRQGPKARCRTALVLLARGFPCTGTHDAIVAEHGASSFAELAAKARTAMDQASPDPESDDGEEVIESEAGRVMSAHERPTLPALDRRVIDAWLTQALGNARTAPIRDEATGTDDDPAATIASALTQALAVVYGADPWVPEALVRMGSTERLDDAAWREDKAGFDEAADAVRTAWRESEAVRADLERTPLDALAAGAMLTRRLLGLTLTRSSVSGEDLDYFAGIMAPAGVALLASAPWLPALVDALSLLMVPRTGDAAAALDAAGEGT